MLEFESRMCDLFLPHKCMSHILGSLASNFWFCIMFATLVLHLGFEAGLYFLSNNLGFFAPTHFLPCQSYASGQICFLWPWITTTCPLGQVGMMFFTGLPSLWGEMERVYVCVCVCVFSWVSEAIWGDSVNYYPVLISGRSYAECAFHNCTSIILLPQQFYWALFPATLKLPNEMCKWEAWYGTEKKWTELSFRKEAWEILAASMRVNRSGSQSWEVSWNVKETGSGAGKMGKTLTEWLWAGALEREFPFHAL